MVWFAACLVYFSKGWTVLELRVRVMSLFASTVIALIIFFVGDFALSLLVASSFLLAITRNAWLVSMFVTNFIIFDNANILCGFAIIWLHSF